jgi:prepilin peptidase CpaA
LINVLLAIFILLALITDAKYTKIPNVLTLSGVCVGFVVQYVVHGLSGLIDSGVGFVVGFVILLLLYVFGALGAGDVKLFAAIGALSGTVFVLQSMMYSVLYAGLIGLYILIARKKLVPTGLKMFHWMYSLVALKDMSTFSTMKEQAQIKFPFMYAVVPGVMTAWYYSLV